MSSFQLRGQAILLDAVLRPVLRVVQLVLTVPLAALLGWYGLWWWLPLPLVMGFVCYEYLFWRRGDRQIRLRFDDTLSIEDPVRGQSLSLNPTDVRWAMVHHRAAGDGESDAFVVVGDHKTPLLAIRLRQRQVERQPDEVDADTTHAIMGGYGGLLRALAPNDRVCRQIVEDPKGLGLAWFREHISPHAWAHTAVRLWHGAEPELDLFGYHPDAHDALLVLGPNGWTFYGPDGHRDGPLLPLRSTRSTRAAVLLRPDDQTNFDPQQVPLLLLQLGGDAPCIAIPSPIAGELGEPQPLHNDLWHTHVPEGAGLIWQLLSGRPRGQWPPALVQAFEDGQVINGPLPAHLIRP